MFRREILHKEVPAIACADDTFRMRYLFVSYSQFDFLGGIEEKGDNPCIQIVH